MGRSLSWIDPAELARRLGRIGVAGTGSNPPVEDVRMPEAAPAWATPSTVTVSVPEAITISDRPGPAAEEPAPAEPEPEPTTDPGVPVPDLDALSISERVAALSEWLQQTVGHFYVADAEGLTIAASEASPPPVSSAALERAMRSLRGLTGKATVAGVTIELEANRVLDTIWTETAYGRIAVGVLGDAAVDAKTVKRLRAHVVETFSEDF